MSPLERRIRVCSLTDVGIQRSENQDHFGEWELEPERRLVVVADGMGGHRGGATASHLAVDVIGQHFLTHSEGSATTLLREAFESANRSVFNAAQEDPACQGMGTTAVGLLMLGGEEESSAWVAHVGDSRAYRLRSGELRLLTRDHNRRNDLIDRHHMSEEEAAQTPSPDALLRAIGPSDAVDVDVSPVSVEPGDVFLLCTDGLWGPVPEADIASILERHAPEDAVSVLVAEAKRNGGPDNITVQVVGVPKDPEPQPAVLEEPLSEEPIESTPARGRWMTVGAIALPCAALGLGGLLLGSQSWVEPDAADPSSTAEIDLPAAIDAGPAERALAVASSSLRQPEVGQPPKAAEGTSPAAARAVPPPPRRTTKATLLPEVRKSFQEYARALAACDLEAIAAVTTPMARRRADRRCSEESPGPIELEIDEKSFQPLEDGGYEIDFEERDADGPHALVATLRRRADRRWQISDMVLRAPGRRAVAPASARTGAPDP